MVSPAQLPPVVVAKTSVLRGLAATSTSRAAAYSTSSVLTRANNTSSAATTSRHIPLHHLIQDGGETIASQAMAPVERPRVGEQQVELGGVRKKPLNDLPASELAGCILAGRQIGRPAQQRDLLGVDQPLNGPLRRRARGRLVVGP